MCVRIRAVIDGCKAGAGVRQGRSLHGAGYACVHEGTLAALAWRDASAPFVQVAFMVSRLSALLRMSFCAFMRPIGSD